MRRSILSGLAALAAAVPLLTLPAQAVTSDTSMPKLPDNHRQTAIAAIDNVDGDSMFAFPVAAILDRRDAAAGDHGGRRVPG